MGGFTANLLDLEIFIVVFTLMWVLLLSVLLRQHDNDVPFGYRTFYYGLATYFIAVILTEVKERI